MYDCGSRKIKNADGLRGMTNADMRSLLKNRGFSTDGNRYELCERITKHDLLEDLFLTKSYSSISAETSSSALKRTSTSVIVPSSSPKRLSKNVAGKDNIFGRLKYPPRNISNCELNNIVYDSTLQEAIGSMRGDVKTFCIKPDVPPCHKNKVVVKKIINGDSEVFNCVAVMKFINNGAFDSSLFMHTYDAFTCGGLTHIISEYVDGITLLKYIMEDRPLKDIFIKIFRAIEQMEKQHMSHRDLHPDNIFVTPNGNIKIFDFGASYVDSTPPTPTISAYNINAIEEFGYVEGLDGWTLLYFIIDMLILEKYPDILDNYPDYNDWPFEVLLENLKQINLHYYNFILIIYNNIMNSGKFNNINDIKKVIDIFKFPDIENEPFYKGFNIKDSVNMISEFSDKILLGYIVSVDEGK